MSWPLLPVAMRVKRNGWPALWLPLFLLWPLLLLLIGLLLPIAVIVLTRRATGFAVVSATYRTLSALHGTSVEFGDHTLHTWQLAFY